MVMGRPKREWTSDQLRRMKAAVEGGVQRDVIGIRFSCGVATIMDLAQKNGWEWPGGSPMSKTQATRQPPPKPKPRNGTFFMPRRTPFVPTEGGSPVRTLTGAEFQARKAELEARDRAERERAHA